MYTFFPVTLSIVSLFHRPIEAMKIKKKIPPYSVIRYIQLKNYSNYESKNINKTIKTDCHEYTHQIFMELVVIIQILTIISYVTMDKVLNFSIKEIYFLKTLHISPEMLVFYFSLLFYNP